MRINKDEYTSHIREPEKLLEMRKIIDKIEIVINNYMIEATDFLDPYERYLAKSILNRFEEISYIEFGGLINSERKIFVIYPNFYDENQIDSKLNYLRVEGDLKDLTHKDFLGALLSLGIKKSKTGDILVNSKNTDIIIKEEISDYILLNLDRVGNRKVKIREIDVEDLIEPQIAYKEISKSLSSLRLDAYLSAVYNLSRQESIDVIQSKRVKINWQEVTKPSKELIEGDVISSKGFGRSILYEIGNYSKKGRIHVIARILTWLEWYYDNTFRYTK